MKLAEQSMYRYTYTFLFLKSFSLFRYIYVAKSWSSGFLYHKYHSRQSKVLKKWGQALTESILLLSRCDAAAKSEKRRRKSGFCLLTIPQPRAHLQPPQYPSRLLHVCYSQLLTITIKAHFLKTVALHPTVTKN